MTPDPDRPKAAWSGTAKLSASQKAERRSAQLEANSRAIIALAALVGRQTGQSGPDVLKRITDAETALTVLDSAGPGARQLAVTWQADAPRVTAGTHQSGTPGLWASSPDHDPRVIQALQRGSDADVARAMAEVTAEYEGRRLERQARDDEYYGRTGDRAVVRQQRPVPAGPPVAFVPRDERGVPQQVSRTVPGSEA